MQGNHQWHSSSSDPLPTLLYGLDPMFSTYTRLFIRHVLELQPLVINVESAAGIDPSMSYISAVKANKEDAVRESTNKGNDRIKKGSHYGAVYCFRGRPVLRVHIFGIVVAKLQWYNRTIYTIDDGTGCIDCIHSQNNDEPSKLASNYYHGDQIHILGRVGAYDGVIQVTITNISIEEEVNSEPILWLNMIQAYKKVYTSPLEIPKSLESFVADHECQDAVDTSKN